MNILQIAEECGVTKSPWPTDYPYQFSEEALERFAASIRAEQKEKIDKVNAKFSEIFDYVWHRENGLMTHGDAMTIIRMCQRGRNIFDADAIRNSKDEPAATVTDRIDEGRI